MDGAAALLRCAVPAFLMCGAAAKAQDIDIALVNARRMVAGEPCGTGANRDEVTVCGRRDADLRHRLPLPAERAVPEPAARDGTAPIAAITPSTPCGIFAGERRCAPREARLYGYGGGRDPLTIGIKVATRLLDPDAEIEPVR